MNRKTILPLLLSSVALPGARAATPRPNIVFILADDLGCSELGCYGNAFNETPNLDRMAADGVRFSNAYSAQTVSSPTRASLMTGLYPQRTGIVDYLRPDDPMHLDEAYTSLPEMLQKSGYRTCLIGKWHLTGYVAAGARYESTPRRHGFGEVMLSERVGIAGGSYFHPYHFNEDIEKAFSSGEEFLVDRMDAEALAYLDRQKGGEPFFLFLSHYAVHTNVHGKPEDVERFRSKPGAGKCPPSRNNKADDPYVKWPSDFMAERNNPHLAAQLYTIDQGVGAIIDKLKEKGLYDNTIIIFTSDNGGEARITSNAPCRGGKSMLYEGGIRIPMIVCAPCMIPGGRVCADPVATFDYYPTFAQAAGARIKGVKPDGLSLWPLLAKNGALPARTLFWHYPLDEPHFLGGRSCGAVHDGDWKLLEFFDNGDRELYNLADDPGEERNLAAENPDVVRRLTEKMQAWRKDTGAQIKPVKQ